MSEVDGATLVARSLKRQGVEFMFGIVGFPVQPDRHGCAKGRDHLRRHAQRAVRLVCRAGRRLSDRPPRRLPRRVGPRCRPRPRRARQRAAERLADDLHRRRVGVVAQRHGGVPGRAPGADRHAVLQVRPCGRARPSHPVLCRDGGQELDLRPARRVLSRHAGRHHHRKGRRADGRGAGALPGPATDPGHAGGRRTRVERAPVGGAAPRHRRQGDGLFARRGRGPRLHRAHEAAVPRLADGQGRDARHPSLVGGRGAQPRAPERRRRPPDGRAAQLDHAFRPAAALQQERAHHPARHRAGADGPERADRGRAARRRQGDRGAAQHGARKARVGLSQGHALACRDRRESGGECGADRAPARRRHGARPTITVR